MQPFPFDQTRKRDAISAFEPNDPAQFRHNRFTEISGVKVEPLGCFLGIDVYRTHAAHPDCLAFMPRALLSFASCSGLSLINPFSNREMRDGETPVIFHNSNWFSPSLIRFILYGLGFVVFIILAPLLLSALIYLNLNKMQEKFYCFCKIIAEFKEVVAAQCLIRDCGL
jgi:hypothetical protein